MKISAIKSKINPKLQGLKIRFLSYARRTRSRVMARIVIRTVLYFPWLAVALIRSWIKMTRWRKVSVCKQFLRRYRLAFENIDPETLTMKSHSGGVSNSSQLWHCRTKEGAEKKYFVKIFVPVGSFWAKHLSAVSPFPVIYGQRSRERFATDMVSRVQLKEKGVPVPKLVAFDPVEQVMVTEYLEGLNVDEILKQINEKETPTQDEAEAILQCGRGLALAHKAGFSLIDTQPINCIWVPVDRRVYFTDLEFCTREDKRVWDVGFFLCFLAIRLRRPLKKKIIELFLSAYRVCRPLNLTGVAETSKELREYLPVFQAILDIRQFTPEELFDEIITG